MVGVAQLAERRVVAPEAAGSIPATHPDLDLRFWIWIANQMELLIAERQTKSEILIVRGGVIGNTPDSDSGD